MKKAIYPGSFDPVTLGHLDVIRRASQLFDHLVIAVLHNSAKTPLFSVEERVKMLEEATKDIRQRGGEGLRRPYWWSLPGNAGPTPWSRGLRAITDFEYELQIAQTEPGHRPGYRYRISDHQLKICLSELQHLSRRWPVTAVIFPIS